MDADGSSASSRKSNHTILSLLATLCELKVPQIRMFFKDEDRTNSFVMLRQKNICESKHTRDTEWGAL